MADSFTFNNFSAGWIPSDDATSGRKNGLLMMDNMELDANGALQLSGGTRVIRSGLGQVYELFANVLNNIRYDYTANNAGTIMRNGTTIGTGGDQYRTAFGRAFDYTLICSANLRLKDTGTTTYNLGIGAPTVGVGPVTQSKLYQTPVLPMGVDVICPIGTWDNVNNILTPDPNTGLGVIQSGSGLGIVDWSTLIYGPGDVSNQTDNDFLTLSLGPTVTNIPDIFLTIQFDILLDVPDNLGTPVENFYTWQTGPLFFSNLVNQVFNIKRSDFSKVGPNNATWRTTFGFRLTLSLSGGPGYIAGSYNMFPFNLTKSSLGLMGGSYGLFGTYDYMQVNVAQTGSYVAKSQMGPIVYGVNANGWALQYTIQTPADPQVNQVWIFRRTTVGTDGVLDQWYRVAVITGPPWIASWLDTFQDELALETDIKFDVALFSSASSGLAARILGIVGPVEGRWFFFTDTMMYPSDIDDPDLYDPELGVRISGGLGETFLWARRLNDNSVIVGTTVDIYMLTGTFITLPDGTVDIYYRSLGCSRVQPVTQDATLRGNVILYRASDGWRTVDSGGNVAYLDMLNLDQMYRGKQPYGYLEMMNIMPGPYRTPVVFGKNKVWCAAGTNNVRIEVYDGLRNYWSNKQYGSLELFALTYSQDGRILAVFNDGSEREIDNQPNLLIDNTTKQSFTILTPFFDGGTPEQRHEFYTIRLRHAISYPDTITVSIITLSGTYTVGTIAGVSGAVGSVYNNYLDLSHLNIPLDRYWQIQITGTVGNYVLNEIEVLYDTRPQQLTHLHLLPSDFGWPGRKRIPSIPFMIDTIGNTASFTTIVDGTSYPALTINSGRKGSFDYFFTSDVPGRDFEFVIDGGGNLFEFFGLGTPDWIEKFPEPKRYYRIPQTNFGNANKKRIRVWPFEINTLGFPVTFIPYADDVAQPSTTFTTNDFDTVRYYFKTDVFAVFYSGEFIGAHPFEIRNVMQPDIVQTLPIARQFDQVGPQEFFKYGKIKQFEYRLFSYGTPVPWNIYFNDNSIINGNLDVLSGREQSYYIGVPMGVAGTIIRMEFGPTNFDFHRFYVRFQVMRSGKDTELEWVTVPDPQQGM